MKAKVRALINKMSGIKIERHDLTPQIIAYAEKNRDQFAFIYEGDTMLDPEPEKEVNLDDSAPVYTEAQLSSKTVPELQELARSHGIQIEGDESLDDLVIGILTAQEA